MTKVDINISHQALQGNVGDRVMVYTIGFRFTSDGLRRRLITSWWPELFAIIHEKAKREEEPR